MPDHWLEPVSDLDRAAVAAFDVLRRLRHRARLRLRRQHQSTWEGITKGAPKAIQEGERLIEEAMHAVCGHLEAAKEASGCDEVSRLTRVRALILANHACTDLYDLNSALFGSWEGREDAVDLVARLEREAQSGGVNG
jgi:hypothetical protein